VSVFQRENIACWTLEQINDQIYLDNDLNNDNAIDGPEMDRLLVNWGIVGTTFLIALNYGSSLTLSLTFDLYTVVIVCNRGNVLTKVMLQQILHLLDLMAIIQSSITI